MEANELGWKIKLAGGIGSLEKRDKRPLPTLVTLAKKYFFGVEDCESVVIYDKSGDALFYLKWLDRDAGKYREEVIHKV